MGVRIERALVRSVAVLLHVCPLLEYFCRCLFLGVNISVPLCYRELRSAVMSPLYVGLVEAMYFRAMPLQQCGVMPLQNGSMPL